MRNLLILIIFFSFNQVNSQEIVGMKEIYIENNIAYKVANNEIYSGIAQRKKRNGHLVYEEEYNNGVILLDNLYFNGKEKRVSNKTIYNPNKPFVLSKEYVYNLESEIFEIITYNDNGIKILLEQFKKGKLTYSCEYIGKKKHGLELGFGDNGEKVTYRCEYNNGKKHGEEFCIKCDGKKIVTKYKNGKKIK